MTHIVGQPAMLFAFPPVRRSLLFSRLRAVVGTADTGRALLLQLNLGPHSDLTEEEFKCAALGFNPGTANA